MAEALEEKFVPSCPIESVDIVERVVNGKYRYDQLVTTIPWPVWRALNVLPPKIDTLVGQLVHTSVDVDYCSENEDTDSHWTYVPSESISHHRMLFRHNFCTGSRGCWKETNARRSGPATDFRYHNEYAYPVNTVDKPEAIESISKWAYQNHILPLGRWGTWEHMNSDVAVELALQAAEYYLNA
jgi:hypothetical protein